MKKAVFRKTNFYDFLGRILPLLFIFFLVLIFFHQILFKNKIFSTPGDLFYFHYPLKEVLSDSLKNGELPLWTNKIATGHPLFAESQIGTLYLPNLILFKFLPPDFALNLSYPIIFLISGLGTYFFLKAMGLGNYGSLYGTIAFSFSTFFVSRIIHFHFIQAVSLLPWEFLFVEKFLKNSNKLYLAGLSFILSQQLFAGFPQAVIFSILGFGSYFVFKIFNYKLIERLKYLLFLAGAIIFGFSLSAVQLIPLLELVQSSSRSIGLSLEELFLHSGTFRNLAKFIYPYIFGDPTQGTYPPSFEFGYFWENTAYVGFLTLILAVFSLILASIKKIKNSAIFFFWFLTVSTALISFAHPTPLTQFFQIPPFSYFRIPARSLFLTAFSLAVLSALAIDKFTKINSKVIRFATILAITLLVFDLFYTGLNFNTFSDRDVLQKDTQTSSFLKNEKGEFRISSLWPYADKNGLVGSTWQEAQSNYISDFAILTPNLNIHYGINSFDEYGSFQTRRRFALLQLIEKGVVTEQSELVEISTTSLKILGAANVKFIVTTFDLKNENMSLKKVFEVNSKEPSITYKIYENPFFLPRVRIIHHAKAVENVSELLEKLGDDTLDFSQTAIVERPLNLAGKSNPSEEIAIIKENDVSVQIFAKSNDNGLLILSDSYYPGWKVYVDGKEGEILAANLNQRAVYLEKGNHDVIFTYEPTSVKIGGLISLIAYALLVIFFFLTLKPRISPKKES